MTTNVRNLDQLINLLEAIREEYGNLEVMTDCCDEWGGYVAPEVEVVNDRVFIGEHYE